MQTAGEQQDYGSLQKEEKKVFYECRKQVREQWLMKSSLGPSVGENPKNE